MDISQSALWHCTLPNVCAQIAILTIAPNSTQYSSARHWTLFARTFALNYDAYKIYTRNLTLQHTQHTSADPSMIVQHICACI